MDIPRVLLIILSINTFNAEEYVTIKIPEWPTIYQACIRFQSTREFLTTGWYVDTDNEWMRLDSYGVPSESNMTFVIVTEEEYACKQFGDPLYIYLYHYKQGLQLDIFPAPNPPYVHCTARKIPKMFPPNPILPGIQFVEQARDNVTTYDHWKAEYFLFTLDYFFHSQTGLPYKMFVGTEMFEFLSIDTGPIDPSIFMLPKNVNCTWAED